MLAFAATFEGLGPDVLLAIFSLSDVYTVLSVTLVNRSLRAITMMKQLWISLVNALRKHSIIETPPSTLSQYTTAQLIGQVGAVIVGPQTWRRDMPNKQPLLAEEITVLLGRPMSERNLMVRLINGNRQFILELRAALEIWDVIDKQYVWTRHGDTRMIVVAQTIENHTLTMAIQHDMTLEILYINVRDWNLVESMLFPHHDMLRGIKSTHIPFNLIPGYLVVAITIMPLNSSIIKGIRPLVYPIATFGSAWRPVSELNNVTYLSVAQFTPIVLETPDRLDELIEILRLLIYESPLQCSTYKIVLYICHQKGEVSDCAVTFRYKCTVCDPGFRWISSGTTPAALSLSNQDRAVLASENAFRLAFICIKLCSDEIAAARRYPTPRLFSTSRRYNILEPR
ncbi:hypothetical protein B0H14DRAFT_3630730 [Mycena olivaceomarginata]|nr:hypothetical protein B0H14DRAFT_3630730 [Mycena olivaceomarginata]